MIVDLENSENDYLEVIPHQYEPVLQAGTANHTVESSSSEDDRGDSNEEKRMENGGIRAVVWTDMFQIILIFACLLSIVIQGIMLTGFENVWNTNMKGQRLHWPDYSPDPLVRHTVWSMSFGGYFMWLYIYGINQSMVQRYVSLPSLRKAQLCVWLNLPMLLVTISLTSIIGLILYTLYHDCDPLKSGKISGRDQILPFFVMTELVKFQGLPGLFLAGLSCGALRKSTRIYQLKWEICLVTLYSVKSQLQAERSGPSLQVDLQQSPKISIIEDMERARILYSVYRTTDSTMSSGMNSLAAVTVTDVIRPYFGGMEENVATHVTKFLVFFYGALCIGFVSIVEKLGSILTVTATFFGIIGGPLAGIFTLGIFFPWANSKGASIGLLLGLFFSMWIGVCELIYQPYIDHPPLSTSGCSANPVDMFMDNINKDNNRLNEILKNESSLMSTTGPYLSPDLGIHGANQSSESIPSRILGNITVEKIDVLDIPAKENIEKDGKDNRAPFAQKYISHFEEQEIGRNKNKEIPVLYRISYLWLSGVGCLTTVIIGLIASLLTGRQDPHDLDPRLVCDISETFCCCLPRFIRESIWPNVGLDYLSEDAAIALLKRKSPPPEIITTEPDYFDEAMKAVKSRNVHFNEQNNDNDDDELYPFDTTDVPYGVIVNQDYENFSKIGNRSARYASLNNEEHGSNTERRQPKYRTVHQGTVPSQKNRSQTLPTDVVHPRIERSHEPRYSYRSKHADSLESESIPMKELNRSNSYSRRPSKEYQPQHELSISSERRASVGKYKDLGERRRERRPEDHRKAARPTHLAGIGDSRNNHQQVSQQRSRESDDNRPVNRVHQQRQPRPKESKPLSSQKKPHKRLLSHEAEKKLNLRDRTYVKNVVMSD
ncbi:Sodium-coupled monocarboxylate transporter 1 [Nymphon striatum]|nr:Sodium-coupled monocarboxylate transporter 1 [Nymphon striatum]